MFADELKESTLQVHQGLEKRLVTQIKKISTVEDYVQLLKLMFGFYAPVYDRVNSIIKQDQRQADSILDDIRYLSRSVNEDLPVSTSLPEVTSYPSALGVLYVTEGSTLGGVIIAGMISKKLNMPAKEGFTFFNAYGEETQSRWQKFREVINGPFTAAEQQEMKESASATFSTFNKWISEYETL